MRKLLCILALLLATPALAQPQQQQSPTQIANQITTSLGQAISIVGQFGTALEALQKQIADLTKERDELKAKLEAKEKDNAKQ